MRRWCQIRYQSSKSSLKIMSLASSYQHLIVSTRGKVGLIQLNRPRAFNALCSPLMAELNQAVSELDQRTDIGAMVLTGSEKAFAGTSIILMA
jgi:enoyl-CoA hydratase/carnithine racemase